MQLFDELIKDLEASAATAEKEDEALDEVMIAGLLLANSDYE